MDEGAKESLGSFLAAQNDLSKTLEPIFSEIKKNIIEKIAPISIGLAEIINENRPQITSFALGIQKLGVSLAPKLVQLGKALHELPDRTRIAVQTLGEHGWYLDTEMPLPMLFELSEAFSDGKNQEAEDNLKEYYQSRLDEVEKYVCTHFPNRGSIIKASFSAHRNGQYILSVPVLLTQADGICFELINESLFIKKDNAPAISEFVKEFGKDKFWEVFLYPLTISLPIHASKKQRGKNFTQLNRHQVLHGEVVDYGNEINSLKAISLVNYLTGVLKDSHEE